MGISKKGLFGKVAAAVFGVMLVGSFMTAMTTFAYADDQNVGYITVDGSTDDPVHYTSISGLLDAAKGYDKTAISIDLECDWNTKDYGRIEIPAGATWTLNLNGHMINRGMANADYDGESGEGVIYAGAGLVTLTVNGGDQSLSHEGYIVTDSNNGQFWLPGSGDDDQSKDIKGGLITGGVDRDTFASGGIIVGAQGTLNLNNVTLAGNLNDCWRDFGFQKGGAAGAIAVGGGCTVNLNASNLIYNHAEGAGGAIAVKGSGSTVNVTNGSNISHNSAADNEDSTTRGGGGAIYVSGSCGATLNIKGGSHLDYNTCRTYGGAMFLDNLSKQVVVNMSESSSMSYNYAKNDGGAVYGHQDGLSFTAEGSEITHNKAGTDGGAFFLNDVATLTISKDMKLTDNEAGGDGGVVYADDSDTVITVDGKGGSGTTVSDNSSEDDGGAFYLDGKSDSLVVSGGAVVEKNSAGSSGGGVYVNATDVNVKLEGGSLNNNVASEDGGCIYHNKGDGAIELSSGASLSGNKSTSGKGGGVYSATNGTEIKVSNAKMDGNSATDGGAIYAEDELKLSFANGSSLSSNKATTGDGGALYINDDLEDDISFDGTTVDGNEAKYSGGAIYIGSDGDACLSFTNGSVVSNNKALNGAGGVMSTIASSSACNLAFSSGEVSGNSAKTFGGVYYTKTGRVSMADGCKVHDNTAEQDGGVCYSTEGGSVLASGGSELYRNKAAGNGGVFYAAKNGSFLLSGASKAYENQAANGGAVCAAGGTVNVALGDASSIKDCKAFDGNGGAIYVGGASVALTSSGDAGTIEACSATGNGGALYVDSSSSSAQISGVKITGCSANQGGGVFFDSTPVTLSDVEVQGNTATTAGGGVYCADGGSSNSIKLAGKVVVATNVLADDASTTSNLSFTGSKTLDGSLSDGSKIGVTIMDYEGGQLRALTTSTEFSQKCENYFSSDNTNYSTGCDYVGDDLRLCILPDATKVVARIIGGSAYATLAEAIEYATDGKTVALLDDVVESVSVSGKNLTFELNGFTLTGRNGTIPFTVADGAKVTVKDGNVVGDKNSSDAGIKVVDERDEGTSLELVNANVSDGIGKTALLVAGGTATVGDGCSLECGETAVLVTGGTLDVVGGTLSSRGLSVAIYGGEANISEGTLAVTGEGGTSGSLAVGDGTKATVTGGTFQGSLVVMGSDYDMQGTGVISVSGGEFADGSFLSYLVDGKYAYKAKGANFVLMDDEDEAIADATCIVETADGSHRLYFEDETEAAEYAKTIEGAKTIGVCRVYFDKCDGSQKTCQVLESGQKATEPEVPTRSDYEFLGWQLDGQKYDFDTAVTSDITLKASWKGQTTPISAAKVVLESAGCTYDHASHEPKVKSVTLGGKTLDANADYDVSYQRGNKATTDFTNAGTITVVVTGKGSYSESSSADFVIAKAKANIKVADPGKKVIGDSFKLQLTTDTDATLEYASSDEGIATIAEDGTVTALAAGTTDLTVSTEANDNYEADSASVTLTVAEEPEPVAVDISKAKVTLSKTSFAYNGKAQKPSVKSVVLDGKTLANGTDYAASMASGKKVGTYKVTITGKGSYAGAATVSYVISPKSVTGLKLKKAKKSFKASWTKYSTERSGVQVRYSTKSSMSGAKTVKASGSKAKTKTVKKLKKKTKYYVQVRAYKVVNGKTYYSGWSAKKSVKTK